MGGVSTEGGVGNFIASKSRAHNCEDQATQSNDESSDFKKAQLSLTRSPRSPHSTAAESAPYQARCTQVAGPAGPRLQRPTPI